MNNHRKLATLITALVFFLATAACDLSTILPSGTKTPLPPLAADEAATSVAAVLATSAAIDAPTQTAAALGNEPDETATVEEVSPSETAAVDLPATETPVVSGKATQSPTEASEISGFKKFNGKGISIDLPDTYVGGNLEHDLDLILAALKKQGSNFDSLVQTIEANRSSFALWAFDTKTNDPKFVTNVNVLSQDVLSGTTLDMVMPTLAETLQGKANILEQKTVTLGSYEMGRIILNMRQNDMTIKEQAYLILDNNVMWLVTFGTTPAEFAERQPVFDQSMETFKIVPANN
jgi:hypothetical protein